MKKVKSEIWEAFGKSEKAVKRMMKDPHNGKLGWWRVTGIRHSAMVRAKSALEAVKKAIDSGEVGDWEYAEAHWFGSKLPNVFTL